MWYWLPQRADLKSSKVTREGTELPGEAEQVEHFRVFTVMGDKTLGPSGKEDEKIHLPTKGEEGLVRHQGKVLGE